MLLNGTIEVHIINKITGLPTRHRPLRSLIMTKKMNNEYYISVKNSMFSEPIDYKLTNIEKIRSRFIDDGKLTLWFRLPQHILLLQGDDVQKVKLLLYQMQRMLKGEKVQISGKVMPKAVPVKKRLNPFDPMSLEHVAVARFDCRVLNMRNLNKLILENCKLPSLPVEIGNLPIAHLSLSGSDITSPQYKLDLFWIWMSGDTICNTLTVLKMDAINLTSLPFEISFLKNLFTLSLEKNQLSYLPHFIGKLHKLRQLNVSNNSLSYFPLSMRDRTYELLDIADNKWNLLFNISDLNNIQVYQDSILMDHIDKYILYNDLKSLQTKQSAYKLSHLSFCTLVNHNIKIKREDIPFTLWHLYDVVAPCIACKKILTPHYGSLKYVIDAPHASTLIQNHFMPLFVFQYLMCKFGCHIKN